ncbi:hypothetical protein GCM10011344_09750 [Dokdonia pacifica]|uniref:Uncharacterized protein n=1 Tax=Dokdonia pacifica TaxID=1627892 RepID=A0A238YQ85_9FLAO|nr:hypothetical protein [Dokdonia pacifica]GGG11079.1 hypothetical protein GCM10011344_09750 [Dokdonia pacifica]SNR72599.1 hypothetical protein SAMN06265376_102221 [Dokdonia pacifica]
MESNKVEQLLEAYFEGATTLAQEKQLRTYFTSDLVAPHLESYRDLFTAFAIASQDTYDIPIHLPKQKKPMLRWISGVAAVVILAIGIATQIDSEPDNFNTGEYVGNVPEEVGVLKTKQALGLMGKMFSESTAQLGAVNEFNTTTSNFFKQ